MTSLPSAAVPCLFCFSQANQTGGQAYQGDFTRIERCYRFLCDLLGVRLHPNEDFTALFHKSYLPLCVSCALVFRNLADLHEHVLRLQRSIDELAVDIQSKIKTSEQDGSLALAFAIQSIESKSAKGAGAGNSAQVALMLSWIQNFRQRVLNPSGEVVSGQSTSGGANPNLVLVTENHANKHVRSSPAKYQVFGEFDHDLNEGPMTIFIGPDVITSDGVGDGGDHDQQSNHGDEDRDDPDFRLDDCDDMSRNGSDDSDYEERQTKQETKLQAQQLKKGSPLKTGKIIQSQSPDKTAFRLNSKPVVQPRRGKKRVKSSSVRIRSPKRGRKKGAKTGFKSSSSRKFQAATPKEIKTIDSSKRFKCHLCPQSFIRPYYLAIHVTSHTGLNSFICRLCPNSKFATLKQVQAHNQLVHGTTHPYGCVKCDFNSSTDEQLKQHMNLKHEFDITGPPYLCQTCNDGVEFGSSHHLKRHLRTHLSQRNNQCCFCDLGSIRKDDIMKHMAKRHRTESKPRDGSSTFKCNMCPEEYPTSIDLITHCWGHGEQNSRFLNCKPCRLHFTTSFEYDIHNEEVHGDAFTRHPCPECDWVLHSEVQLQRHLLLHDPNRPKNHKCDLCSKSFFTMFSYEKHVSLYHPDPTSAPVETYQCTECSKTYVRKVDLVRCIKRHKRVVDPEQHKCLSCDKVFNVAYDLKKHNFFVHSDLRPKCCKECPATFKVQHQLTRHEKMFHSDEAKAANRVYVYRERKSRDDGEGSLMCEFCGRVCSSRQVLRRHHQTVHSDNRPFQCSGCDKAFKRQDDLKKHKDKFCVMTLGEKRIRQKKTSVEEDVKYVMNRLLKSVAKKVKNDETKQSFPCKTCDDVFPSISVLRRHVLSVHSENKLFKCTKCDLRFGDSVELTKHVRTGQCFNEDFQENEVDVVEMALKMTEESVGMDRDMTEFSSSSTRTMKRKSAMRHSQFDTDSHGFQEAAEVEDNVKMPSVTFAPSDESDPDFAVDSLDEEVSDGESDSSHSFKKKKSISAESRILKCRDCSLTFDNLRHLQRHQMSIHSNSRPYGCGNCEKTFKRTDDLLKHHRKSKCVQSLKGLFDSKDSDSDPLKKSSKVPDVGEDSNPKTDTVCKICCKQFGSWHTLQRHEKTIHSDSRPFSCEGCTAAFKRRDDLLKHMRKNCKKRAKVSDGLESDAEYFSANESETDKSSKISSTAKATKKVPGSEFVECNLCHHFFAIERINRHKEIKHKGKCPFRCMYCSESYELLEDYIRHSVSGKCTKKKTNRRRSVPVKSYEDLESNVTFPQITYSAEEEILRSRYSDVLSNKEAAVVLTPLQDSGAGRPTSPKPSTSGVNRITNSSRKSISNRSSKLMGPKSKRRKLENDPKSLTCGACNISFTLMAGLNRHMLTIHSSERPFKCGVCSLTFKRKDDMMKHTRKQHPHVALPVSKGRGRSKKKTKTKTEAIVNIKTEPKSEVEKDDDESSVGSEFEFGPKNPNEDDDDENYEPDWNTVVYMDDPTDASAASSDYALEESRDEDFSD